jgi:hypothetical protein
VKIRDYSGDEKSHPVYFDDGADFAAIQAWATAALPDLDGDIDGQIVEATVTLNVTLPAGLKSTAADGNRVREGANLTYAVTGSSYVNTLYVPSWANDHFNMDTVDVGDTSGTYVYDLHHAVGATGGAQPTDKYGNANAEFVKGIRAFRK